MLGVGAITSRGTVGASGGLTIVVNGALDPEAVARQIKRILAGHDRRAGAEPSQGDGQDGPLSSGQRSVGPAEPHEPFRHEEVASVQNRVADQVEVGVRAGRYSCGASWHPHWFPFYQVNRGEWNARAEEVGKRVAAGDVELWRQIFLANRAGTLKAVADFETVWKQFRIALESADGRALADLLAEGKRRRDAVGS